MLLLQPPLRLRLRPAWSWIRLRRRYKQGPLKEPKRLLAKPPLRLRPAWSWIRLRRRYNQGSPVPARRKRSRKEWLLRNALHQRRRPTQRKRPARLLKRNEFKRARPADGFCLPLFIIVLDAVRH